MALNLSRRRAVVRIAAAVFSLTGLLVVAGLVVFVGRLDFFGRIIADRVLANAIVPSARQMPYTTGQKAYSSSDIQVIGGRGQGLGCSLPPLLALLAFRQEEPIGLQMRQACATHDYCYRHGAATYGYTQADCDFMLQEQAFRLCRFIEKEKNVPIKKSDCIRSARLITLGVRIGGSDAFRPTIPDDESSVATCQDAGVDGCASTYFEYDPYPVRSSEFWAFRIADPPAALAKSRNQKALYYFRLRPAGMRIYAAPIGEKPQFRAYPLVDDEHLSSAPLVVAVNNGGATEDWFVWWQRLSLEGTAGRIVAIAPGRATPTDWLCLGVPDRPSTVDGRPDCRETTNALLVAQIGKKDPEDPRFSEIWPASFGGSESNKLLLAALTTHTCISESNIPCFVYVRLDVDSNAKQQPQEPMRVTDRFSPERPPKRQTEEHRYRNYVANPIVLHPPGEPDPVFIWMRRGIGRGVSATMNGDVFTTMKRLLRLLWTHRESDGYESTAWLRRIGIDRRAPNKDSDDTGRSRGTVELVKLREADEPVFVVGRNSAAPFLASLSSNKDDGTLNDIRLTEWRLPALADNDNAAEQRPPAPAQLEDCAPKLDGTWLARPWSVVATPQGATVVLTRIRINPATKAYQLQVAALAIALDGRCPLGAVEGASFDVGTLLPSVRTDGERLEKLRRAPLLVDASSGDGPLTAILPFPDTDLSPRILCRINGNAVCTE